MEHYERINGENNKVSKSIDLLYDSSQDSNFKQTSYSVNIDGLSEYNKLIIVPLMNNGGIFPANSCFMDYKEKDGYFYANFLNAKSGTANYYYFLRVIHIQNNTVQLLNANYLAQFGQAPQDAPESYGTIGVKIFGIKE